MSETIDHIVHTDQELFLWLNGQHKPFWDAVMALVTNKLTWIPLYLLLVYSLIKQFKIKSIGYILSIIAVVALSDQLASTFLKPYFARPRPCHDPALESLVHLIGGCGGAYGFVSSHAATSFGIAMIFNLLPTKQLPGIRWLFVWALVYSYSRIYAGVHYPLDLAGGAVVGVLVALLVWIVFKFYTNPRNSQT